MRRVKTVVLTKIVDAAELEALRQPKQAPTIEHLVAPDVFGLEDGPFDHYERRLEVEAERTADGRFTVHETTDFKVAIPVWGVLFTPLFVGIIKRPPDPDKPLWFLPPDHMSKRATEVLSLLCVFSVIAGYLGVLLSQTNAFFQKDFGVTNTEISDVQISVRIGAFLAFVIVAFADRRGRRKVLLAASVIAILLAATGALAPNLFWLGVSQGLARAFSAAIGLLILIIASEEMPAGGRAFAVSVLAMTAALGAGGVVLFLWVMDLAPWAWRIFYVTPLLFLFTLKPLARRLPETKRYEVFELRDNRPLDSQHTDSVESVESVESAESVALAEQRRAARAGRFAMLGAVSLFYNLFLAPANGFQNNFLRNEQGFSGGQIGFFQVITTVPPGIMLIVGGRLADKYGRRLVGTIGVIGNTTFTVAMYNSTGWTIWLFSGLSVLFGVLVIPALGVYQSEMFATGSRGRASGGINLLAVAGAVIGLKLVGMLADQYGSFGPAVALVGLGPAIVAGVVLLFYPETTHRELEELNPEDEPPPEDPEAIARLDEAFDSAHAAHARAARDADGTAPPGTMLPRG